MWSGGGSAVSLRNKLRFAGTQARSHPFNHSDYIYKKVQKCFAKTNVIF